MRCERELRLDHALTLHDHIELSEEKTVTWVFMLRHEPKAGEGAILAGPVRIVHAQHLDAQIEEIPVTDARMAKNFPGRIWRLTLTGGEAMLHDETFVVERANSHE